MAKGATLSGADAKKIETGTHPDPFSVLGRHDRGGQTVVTVFDPGASEMTAVTGKKRYPLAPVDGASGVFSGAGPKSAPYVVEGKAADGSVWTFEDPYRFGPVLGELDEYLISEGTHQRLWQAFGAHVMTHEGAEGTNFAVWAPAARRVSVVGDFNDWDGRRHVMRHRGTTGIWEIFLPGVGEGAAYKYEIVGGDGTLLPLKADPVGFGSQHPPENASVVRDISGYGWKDGAWMETRAGTNARTAPISVYEVHLGSWRRREHEDGRPLSYREAAEELVDYAADMGFTHLELMPVSEYPFNGSWGYQPVGLYAPTIRFGPPHEFRDLVDAAHQAGLGVILDWVPGHFPSDDHGLGRFDGTALYEHADPRQGFHRDWNTLIYNFGRNEVANFLRASALYWLKELHVDALRVDAVASMLYLDYSRDADDWVPNRYGGRENLDAIEFLGLVNDTAHEYARGSQTIAEESTAWPGVSRPRSDGGLGFDFKWNMGWMHDTLGYMSQDPVYRRYHHGEMTFGLIYAFSENFVLPLSHDEVVHGKGSLLNKMPGDRWQKFANLRAYLGFMWGHPGKKLLFMGGEFGQEREWNHDQSLDWHLLDDAMHDGVRKLVRDLNALYREHPALHRLDCSGDGFRWIEGGDTTNNVFSFLRLSDDGAPPVAVVCNMAPVRREAYRIGVPQGGTWREVLNTDAADYGGTGVANETLRASDEGMHGLPNSISLVLPPLGSIFLIPETR